MGRWLEGRLLEERCLSPFFCTGAILAVIQSLDRQPESIES